MEVQDGRDGTSPRRNELDDACRCRDLEVLDAEDDEGPIVTQGGRIRIFGGGDLCHTVVKKPEFSNLDVCMGNIDVEVGGWEKHPIQEL